MPDVFGTPEMMCVHMITLVVIKGSGGDGAFF